MLLGLLCNRHDTVLKSVFVENTLSGPEIMARLKIGSRVQRGIDWRWEDQDGGKGGKGSVVPFRGTDTDIVSENGFVRIQWDHNGSKIYYRMGNDSKYELRTVGLDDGEYGYMIL